MEHTVENDLAEHGMTLIGGKIASEVPNCFVYKTAVVNVINEYCSKIICNNESINIHRIASSIYRASFWFSKIQDPVTDRNGTNTSYS